MAVVANNTINEQSDSQDQHRSALAHPSLHPLRGQVGRLHIVPDSEACSGEQQSVAKRFALVLPTGLGVGDEIVMPPPLHREYTCKRLSCSTGADSTGSASGSSAAGRWL
eukprot:SAG11_NODE_450_length_9391_cov_16.666272_4_plen_110_part_00